MRKLFLNVQTASLRSDLTFRVTSSPSTVIPKLAISKVQKLE